MNFYANPKVPEGLSVSHEPARLYFKRFLIILGLVAGILVVFDLAARLLVPFLPFRWEQALVPPSLFKQNHSPEAQAVEDELAALASRLIAVMDLPQDMTITVHYHEDDIVNAFAVLGGQIIVYRGLLEKMDSENALAMVLAHEIGHVKNRDMAKGMVKLIALTFLLSSAGSSADGLLNGLTEAGMLSFSRSQESAADIEAALALGRLYGHTRGVESFFNHLSDEAGSEGLQIEALEILSTHPDSAKRIRRSQAAGKKKGWPAHGQLTPLPDTLSLKSSTD